MVGTAPDGSSIQQISLERDGLSVSLLSLGAILQDLRITPHSHSMVLGYPDVDLYLTNPNYMGATVGRFANRLRHGRAPSFDANLQVQTNTPFGHHLHGGTDGAWIGNWGVADCSHHDVVFTTTLPDGHMGFPGNLHVNTRYALLPERILDVQITATTDAATLCSFAHHSYFNLTGRPDIEGHSLKVHADHYLPLEQDGIPTGSVQNVADTEFDFRSGRALSVENFYDHNLCLSLERGELQHVATLSAPATGIEMEILTTEPGLQIYTGQAIEEGGSIGHNGFAYGPCAGIALEPQLWPDAPNNAGFPSAVLKPTETYQQRTQFKF